MSLLMTDARTDEQLLPDVARGDEAAIEVLLERYWGRAYGLAYRLVGEAHAAEDVAQEAFVKMLAAAASFDTSRSFRPWFFQILTHQARKHHRSDQRRAKHEARAAKPDRDVPAGDEAEAVQRCLSTLPEDQREPIALHYLSGLTFQEVADALACPLGTVTSRVRRGLESLRTRLQPTHALSSAAIVEWLARTASAPGTPSPLELLGALRGEAPATLAAAPQAQTLVRAARRGRRARLLALVALPLVAGAALAIPLWAELPGEQLAQAGPGDAAPAPLEGDGAAEADGPLEGDDAPAAEDRSVTPAPAEPAQADGAAVAPPDMTAGPSFPALKPGLGAVAVQVQGPDGLLREAELGGLLTVTRRGRATHGWTRLQTDAEGWLVVPDLPPSTLSLDLSYGDLRAERLTVLIEAGLEQQAQARLHLGACLDARVTLDGPPVEVVVALRAIDAPDATPVPRARISPTDGRLHVGALAPGDYALSLSAPGYATLQHRVTLEGHDTLDLGELHLGGQGILRGRVQQGDGHPAAKVDLTVSRGGTFLGETQTDEQGRFRFAGAQPGQLTLTLSDGSAHTVELLSAGEQVLDDLVLSAEPTRLVGCVVGSDGLARTGVLLTLQGLGGDLGTVTAADGSFEFGEVQPGAHELKVAWGGETCPPREVVLGAGETVSVELILERGGALRGRVAGRPSADRWVSLVSTRAGSLPPRLIELRIDEQGRYSIAGLPAGTYRVVVRGAEPREVEIRAGETREVDFDGLQGAGSVELQVTGEHGPQRFMAFASSERLGMLGMAPGGEGTAVLADVPAGTVDVGVVVPGSLPQLTVYARDVQVLPHARARIEIAWPDPAQSGGVHGQVVLDLPGDVPLSVQASSRRADMLVELGSDGSFELQGLPAGTYELTVQALGADEPFARGEVTVHAGETTAVELR